MTDRLKPGPYRFIRMDDGIEVPFYIIPFDKRGICDGPETRRHLINSVKEGAYSDIFLFSHGWNNDWSVATKRYEDFLKGYMTMRRARNLPMPSGYRPLLVGIFWPSTALVFGESETGPKIAAADPEAMDARVAEERREIRELADELPADQAGRFYELVQKPGLSEPEALELAKIARSFYHETDDELQTGSPLSEKEIVSLWAAASPEAEADLEDFGTTGGAASEGPQAAGLGDLFKKLDPRNIVRTLTVYQMKDRAGTVGARGVGPLLRELLAAGSSRLHLIGHSYGGKVVLSAAGFGDDLPRKVESMLLLQPAVSHLCFAQKVPGTDHPGGYREALARVNKPILTTFSAHDFPLTKTFHLALRRKDDLGEAKIAGVGDPPSKYAALGGFGPRGAGEALIDIRDAGQPYQWPAGTEIIGLRGTRTIKGHGDISNESTWWALYSLASQ
ncbi:alpha/beta fold hydrolase [Desulfococcus sp.]|uniref:alpha/beta fold hydrolase n=1 Tax=Desulfococcus sp. TaxID=2025834 RepID=UPI003594236C